MRAPVKPPLAVHPHKIRGISPDALATAAKQTRAVALQARTLRLAMTAAIDARRRLERLGR